MKPRAPTPGASLGDREMDVPVAVASPRARTPLRDGFAYCLAVFVGVRALFAVIGLIAVGVLPAIQPGGASIPGAGTAPGPVGVPGWPAAAVTPGWHNLVTMWERFDALWYLRIAEEGYRPDDGSAAFFPLYPVLVGVVSVLLGGRPLAAGLLVSNLAALGSLVVLYALTKDELSEQRARATVVFAALFPSAFFFAAPYTESLFLFLVLLSLRAARWRRWELAGTLGALAALTRSLGLLLVLPLVVEAAHQTVEARPRPWGGQLPRRLWALAPAVGTGAYLLWWELRSGDWLAPLHHQAGWQRELVGPWAAVVRAAEQGFGYVGSYPGGYHLLDWVVAVPVVLLAGYALLRFRPLYGVYTWAAILPALLFVFPARPLMSFPRFALPLFPVFWALAVLTEGSPLRRQLTLAVSAALLGVMLLLFSAWWYVF